MSVEPLAARGRRANSTDAGYADILRPDFVFEVLSNPSAYPDHVVSAMRLLAAETLGSSSHLVGASTSSSAPASRLDRLLLMVTAVIDEDDDDLDQMAVNVPQFVPANWTAFLDGPERRDPDFEMPWYKNPDL